MFKNQLSKIQVDDSLKKILGKISLRLLFKEEKIPTIHYGLSVFF
ncbi:hypothetical protein [Psychrobacillus glaciei]|nr:hypothetical protein [Psychrobacillus glaciei]